LTRNPILLVGAGGHSKACIDVIEQGNRFHVIGLIGLAEEVGTKILGYPVLGTDADLPNLLQECSTALVTLGQIKTPEPRIRLFMWLKQIGYQFPAIVSPHAYVSRHATLGEGTIIMHGAVVNAAASIGDNCIINSHSLIEHDVVVSDHCHVSTLAVVNGGVHIGLGTFVGSGSSVRQNLVIGERSLIGMGQRVLVDCPPASRIPAPKPV
jgi:sugar O-acyltransferase (sialic acid O-acetyltransferase NeuD family)